MSGPAPPHIDTIPGTPSKEWAHATTTAAFARSDPAPAIGTSSSPLQGQLEGVSISAANESQKGSFDPDAGALPGAYPITPRDQLNDPTSVKDIAQSAAQQASAFVNSAASNAAHYMPQGIVDTVSSYIPTSFATTTMSTARASEHDTVHNTSFPTTELSGSVSGEHVGGVGSLPGPVNEAAVAKLPDERVDDERYLTTAAATAAIASGAYALKDRLVGSVPVQDQVKGSVQKSTHAFQSKASSVQDTAQSTVTQAMQSVPGTCSTAVAPSTRPTQEPFGAQPGDHSSGVGALPGNLSEPHVARLPEESAHPQYDSGDMDTVAQVSLWPSQEAKGNEASVGEIRHVDGVGALVGNRSEEAVAMLPDERPKAGFGAVAYQQEEKLTESNVADKTQSETRNKEAQERQQPREKDAIHNKGVSQDLPIQGDDYNTDYHPAQLHPPTMGASDPSTQASAGEKSLGATQADANRSTEEQQPPHQALSHSQSREKQHKATFMEKMKGEAKVLIGKIERDSGKVEQGQKMKAGENKS